MPRPTTAMLTDDEFYMWIGKCITTWAKVKEWLFKFVQRHSEPQMKGPLSSIAERQRLRLALGLRKAHHRRSRKVAKGWSSTHA
jgi:hypothetical protein